MASEPILCFIQTLTSSIIILILTVPATRTIIIHLPAPQAPPPLPPLSSRLPTPLITTTIPAPSKYLEGHISIRSAAIILVIILILSHSSGPVRTRPGSGE